MLFPDDGRAATAKRPRSCEGFIEHDSKSIDVTALAGRLPLSLFGRDIEGHRQLLAVEGPGGGAQQIGQTEIGEHGLTYGMT